MVGGLTPTWKYSISAYSVREGIKHHTNVTALSTFILPPYYDKVGLLAYQPTVQKELEGLGLLILFFLWPRNTLDQYEVNPYYVQKVVDYRVKKE